MCDDKYEISPSFDLGKKYEMNFRDVGITAHCTWCNHPKMDVHYQWTSEILKSYI